jgi:8-amino-7-oxononanoate synthase
MGFQRQIRDALEDLRRSGLLRTPFEIRGAQGPEIEIQGRRVLCLCSNNYLGLASHPSLVAAAVAACQQEGVGSGASRLVTGTMRSHREAEAAFAGFLQTPSAALFASGYDANVGAIQALVGPGDAVFSDALNHASLIDGCRLSRAEVHVYAHRDVGHLESLLRLHRPRARRALIVTDSLFSMDGVVAPLRALATTAREFEAGLLVDEAHAIGVMGPRGRGLAAAQEVEPDALIATLGKSFGVAGAFVAGTEPLVALVRNRARSFVFSTAPPPMIARAATVALELVQGADEARRTLLGHARRLRAALRTLGYEAPEGESHIIPVLIGSNEATMQLSGRLLEQGVFVQGIRPPTVPPGTARLRVTPMATHTSEQIDRAIGAFAALSRAPGEQ